MTHSERESGPRRPSGELLPPDNLLLRVPISNLPKELYTDRSDKEMSKFFNTSDNRHILQQLLTIYAHPSRNRGAVVGLSAIQFGGRVNMFAIDWTAPKSPVLRPKDYIPCVYRSPYC